MKSEARLTTLANHTESTSAENTPPDHQASSDRMPPGPDAKTVVENDDDKRVDDSGNVNTANPANPPLKANGEIDDELGGVPVEVEHVTSSKKKRKKSKPKSKRGLVSSLRSLSGASQLTIFRNKPTGFEEYHADGPLRPEDVAEDQELYSNDYPFINRILTAIQRFERTRKLTPERRDVFYKYLAYGGVDVGPHMFQSVAAFDKEAREGMSKTELAAAMSQLSIGDDKYDTSSPSALYAVDFEGCMKGFLSRRASLLWGFETRESVSMVTTTLERFMDYLLQHDVCPEYKVPVLATRDLCREATTDLWAVAEAFRWLPGDFNVACSTLFQGQYAQNYDGATDWGPAQQGQATFVGMTPAVADQVVKFGVAGAATEDVYQAFQSCNQAEKFEDRVQVVETNVNVGFEITSITPPTKDCIRLYKTQSQDFRPVGRVHARPWKNPASAPEDLTKEEKEARTQGSVLKSKEEYVFFVESVILNNLHIGFRGEATIHKLNCGIWFFDDFVNGFPSFDTYLPNEIMGNWKEPRWLEGSLEHEKQQEQEKEQQEADEQAEGGDRTENGLVEEELNDAIEGDPEIGDPY